MDKGPAGMEGDEWKSLNDEWAQQPPVRPGFASEEDLRAGGDGFGSGPGIIMEPMAQPRMGKGEFVSLSRGEARAVQPGAAGSDGPYAGTVANGPAYPAIGNSNGAKDDMRRAWGEMRAIHEGNGVGMGAMQGGLNLANSLQNTSLGNYLTSEARAVSAPHRQVLVKVVCNYRRTDDLNPGGRASPPEAQNNRCKTILAFQEGNGTHLCFGMFVKEYIELAQVYIDSVDSTPLLEGENGEDRQKTMTSIVLAYMNHAKMRGFKRLYLRVAPPTDENSFIFTRRLPNVRFRASMHLSLWFKYIVQAASRNGIVHSSKWSTSAVELEFPTWMLREDDHHAEEAYRTMTASLVQVQQGAKDLVEVANRLQDRFFCVFLHNPSAKVKAVDDDGIMVESAAMRDRVSFAEVCIRQHLRFNVAEASSRSSTVLIAMISKEQQDGGTGDDPVGQQQQPPQPMLMNQQQQAMPHETRGDSRDCSVPASIPGRGGSEEARQRGGTISDYLEGEQDIMIPGSARPAGSRGVASARVPEARGVAMASDARSKSGPGAVAGGGQRYPHEMDMMEGGPGGAGGRVMGSMAGGMLHGGHYPADVAAFYGHPSHIDSMMSSGYIPSHRIPYGGMHGGYPAEVYGATMDEMKNVHAKHAVGMGMHPDMRMSGYDPRMAGRGMWMHPSATGDPMAMKSMGLMYRYGRGDGIDPRMVDMGYSRGYAGQGSSMRMSSQEMQMMHGMAGSGPGGPRWGHGMSSAMGRKQQGGGAVGRTASGSASGGRAGIAKKRGGNQGGAMPPSVVMPGYGGEDPAAGMYADHPHAQEHFEQAAGGERKRSIEEMRGQEEMDESKRAKTEDAKASSILDPGRSSPNVMAQLKEEAGEDDSVMLQQTIAGEADSFLSADAEADSFLSAPEPGTH